MNTPALRALEAIEQTGGLTPEHERLIGECRRVLIAEPAPKWKLVTEGLPEHMGTPDGDWQLFWLAMRNGEVRDGFWTSDHHGKWDFYVDEGEYGWLNVTPNVVAYMPLDMPRHPDTKFNCPQCSRTVTASRWSKKNKVFGHCFSCKVELLWQDDHWVETKDKS